METKIAPNANFYIILPEAVNQNLIWESTLLLTDAISHVPRLTCICSDDTVNASSKDFIALHQTIAQAYWALTIWEILICDFGGCVLGFRGGASLTFGTLICFYCYCYVYFTPCPPNNGNSEPPLQIKLALQHHYTYISITCQSTKLTTIGWLLYSFVHTIYASSSLHSGWLHITSRLFLGKFGLLIVHVGAHWCTCNSLAI